jgi:hypothetical protein
MAPYWQLQWMAPLAEKRSDDADDWTASRDDCSSSDS